MKRYLLIDYYNLFIRAWTVIPITNEDGEHFGGTFGFLRGMKSAIDLFKPTDVIVAMDGPNSGLRRKMINKEYKAGRKKDWKRGVVKAYDFLNEADQSDNFNMQVKRINEYLDVLPVKNINVPYVEADDIIAEICNTNEDQCIIYSTDADYKQLISDRVACYNPMAKQLTTKARFIEKYGFLPENFIFYKMITGDASDGLVGVKGIGPKTFLKLFPNAAEEIIESTNDLLNYSSLAINSQAVTPSMKAKHKIILESSELLQTNWTMMQLQEVEISQQTKDVVQTVINRKPNEFNRLRLRVMFIEDKLQSQVKSFDDWSRAFSGVVLKGRSSNEK